MKLNAISTNVSRQDNEKRQEAGIRTLGAMQYILGHVYSSFQRLISTSKHQIDWRFGKINLSVILTRGHPFLSPLIPRKKYGDLLASPYARRVALPG